MYVYRFIIHQHNIYLFSNIYFLNFRVFARVWVILVSMLCLCDCEETVLYIINLCVFRVYIGTYFSDFSFLENCININCDIINGMNSTWRHCRIGSETKIGRRDIYFIVKMCRRYKVYTLSIDLFQTSYQGRLVVSCCTANCVLQWRQNCNHFWFYYSHPCFNFNVEFASKYIIHIFIVIYNFLFLLE